MYLHAVRDIKEMSPDVNLLFMSSLSWHLPPLWDMWGRFSVVVCKRTRLFSWERGNMDTRVRQWQHKLFCRAQRLIFYVFCLEMMSVWTGRLWSRLNNNVLRCIILETRLWILLGSLLFLFYARCNNNNLTSAFLTPFFPFPFHCLPTEV